MNNSLSTFNHSVFSDIRTTLIDGEPWFVAKDVCTNLGISKNRDAVSRLDEDERVPFLVDTLGGRQETTVISESGLYALVFKSRKKEAKAFQKWITSEVIPQIRKTGSYSMNHTSALPTPLETAKMLVTALESNQKLEHKVAEDAPKVEFYDTVTASGVVVDMATAAQIAELPFGSVTLYRKLRKMDVLISGTSRHNRPKQRYINQGLFTLEERSFKNPKTEEVQLDFKTCVTQKGIDWLIKTFGTKPQEPELCLVETSA